MSGMHNSRDEQPRLSVILPVYHAETTLQRTLNSLFAATEKSLEIVCVNDGSTDASGDILRKAAETDVRVVVLEQENQGVSAARNAALKICTGKYVIFVDADDEVTPDYFSNLLRDAEAHDADLVVCGYSTALPNGALLQKSFTSEVCTSPSPNLLASLPVGVCSHLYKRAALETKNGIALFPTGIRYGEDTAFHYAVYPRITKLVISAERGYIIHESPGSATCRSSELVADMSLALEWLLSVHGGCEKTEQLSSFLVLFASHTLQRIYALSTLSDISANLSKFSSSLLKSGISENCLTCISTKHASRLRAILRGNVRPPISYYFKQFRKKLKSYMR